LVIVFLVITALEAPIPEEFAKALGPVLMGRRIQTERQAFAIGLASGAGFAILENMLYQGIYADWSGWGWAGVTTLRAFGSVMHPLGTAIIALAWFRARQRDHGWLRRLAGAYLLSVGLHTLWNGGFQIFVYLTGMDYYQEVSIYGMYVELMLIIFLVLISIGLWGILRRYVVRLGREEQAEVASWHVSRRALALWAFACAAIIIPIGAALGPAWKQIVSVVVGGNP
jgi:RsiW-degrading membrane proteinase PrsW (M82 family)